MIAPLVIYHANCFDGFTAAWVAHRALSAPGTPPELCAAQYGQDPPDVTGRDVYILDFSYKPGAVVEMAKQARSVLVLDHHAKMAEKWADFDFCAPVMHRCTQAHVLNCDMEPMDSGLRVVYDMGDSGASLAWKHFYGDKPVPQLVQYVRDRDLWKWEMPRSREINAWLRTHDFGLDRWTYLSGYLATGAG